jgi:hypothetical protein
LAWNQTEPGPEVAPTSEGFTGSYGGCCAVQTDLSAHPSGGRFLRSSV